MLIYYLLISLSFYIPKTVSIFVLILNLCNSTYQYAFTLFEQETNNNSKVILRFPIR